MNPRPPLNFFSVLASCYPLGFMPKAPGTWGSLPGLVIGLGIYHLCTPISLGLTIGSLLLLSLLSYAIIHKTEVLWNSHDDKRIVLDEVVGQAIPLAFIAPSIEIVIVSFVLFRIFDITKPLFIGWADQKIPGALGTLLDDVFAGLVVLGILILDGSTFRIFT